MKKILLSFILVSSTTCLFAQYDGHVGINTPTPIATLHVKANGSTATTQSLKVESSTGANLLTINDDGTVSGAAAVNLSSGTATSPKGSGIFTATASSCTNCFLSPNSNTSVVFNGAQNDPNFYRVAQAVPYNTVVDKLNFSVYATANYSGGNPILVQLLVNGVPTGLSTALFVFQFTAGQTYSPAPVTTSVPLFAGDRIAYQILGLGGSTLIGYVSMRYTEQ